MFYEGLGALLAHRCTILLCYLGCEIDDKHRNTNMNDKDHQVGQLTRALLALNYG